MTSNENGREKRSPETDERMLIRVQALLASDMPSDLKFG